MDILKTRLYKPVVKTKYVIRSAIFDYLNEHSDNPLTLVVAAAGYGKSVTISQWLDHKGSKYGWVSLDKDCNNFNLFLLYLVSCVQHTYPESLKNIQSLTNNVNLPPVKVLVNLFINEIAVLKEDFILVLDDYHLISNTDIHELIGEILKHPSEKLKLFILSRKDPPLIMSALKAYDHVSEIRMSELRFSKREVIDLANRITGQPFSDKTVDELVRATEGWIIGLRLAIQSIIQGIELKVVLSDLVTEKQAITQFLIEEILHPQSQFVRECLYKASILSRFCEGLLSAVCADDEIQNDEVNTVDSQFFTEIINKTLFIIPLDSDHTWFRFHHIFGDILQKQLEKKYAPDQILAIHGKAGRWLEKNGFWDEAFQHALKSNDINLAVNIIEKNKHRFIDTDKFGHLARWLELLPAGTIEKHLSLLLTRAFLYDAVKDYTSMRNDLAVAEKLIAKNNSDLHHEKQLLGEFHTVYGNLAFNEGNFEDAYIHSNKALVLLTDSSAYLRDYALAHKAFSLNALGKFNDAITILKNVFEKLSPSNSVHQLRNLILQSMVNAFHGNLPEIEKLAIEYHAISIKKKLWISLAYSTYYLTETHYQWNNLYKAATYAITLGDHYYSGRPPWVLLTLYTKAFTYLALKKNQELNQAIEEIREVTENINNEVFHYSTRAFEVELAIRQNEFGKAWKLARKTNFDSFLPIFFYYFPQLTWVKILMISNEPEKIVEAEERLGKLITLGRAEHKHNILMQALLLQSLLFRKKNDFESSVQTLNEAIKLAEPGGFIRIFVDLGEEMKTLLADAYKIEPDNRYIEKLLLAFKSENASAEKKDNLREEIVPDNIFNGSENLTPREISLLKLIAEGYLNKEIAEKLFLSTNSVKKYLYITYQKLEVTNRTNAVNKARKLKLI